MKNAASIILLGTLIFLIGCASLQKCGIFYEAYSAGDKAALVARFDALRAALASDPRLKEEPERGYRLRFIGVRGSEFEFLAVSDSELVGSSTLVVIGCPYEDRNSDRVMKLRKIVEAALGPDLTKKLKGEVRHTMLAETEPNQASEPMGGTVTPPAEPRVAPFPPVGSSLTLAPK